MHAAIISQPRQPGNITKKSSPVISTVNISDTTVIFSLRSLTKSISTFAPT